jgi:hypothetical protein
LGGSRKKSWEHDIGKPCLRTCHLPDNNGVSLISLPFIPRDVMSKIPQTNVVGVFAAPAAAEAAAEELRNVGFGNGRVGVLPQGSHTVVTVQADGHQTEGSTSLEDSGASAVQTVAR